jgi:hypothetical protein
VVLVRLPSLYSVLFIVGKDDGNDVIDGAGEDVGMVLGVTVSILCFAIYKS